MFEVRRASVTRAFALAVAHYYYCSAMLPRGLPRPETVRGGARLREYRALCRGGFLGDTRSARVLPVSAPNTMARGLLIGLEASTFLPHRAQRSADLESIPPLPPVLRVRSSPSSSDGISLKGAGSPSVLSSPPHLVSAAISQSFAAQIIFDASASA